MRERGFTLLEMSIVVVIIGMLVGGILAGQALLRNSQYRAVISDVEVIAKAAQTFKDKYGALPGDFPGATALWGAAHADTNTCKTTAGSGITTCNGGGDGRIGTSTFGAYGMPDYETFRFWQHLVNAEMYKGKFTGIYDATAWAADAPFACSAWINCAPTSMGGFAIIYEPNGSDLSTQGVTLIRPQKMGHVLIWHAGGLISTGTYWDGLVTPMDAKSIDTKVDDGKAQYGAIQAPTTAYTDECVTQDGSNGDYDTGQAKERCSLIFKLGF